MARRDALLRLHKRLSAQRDHLKTQLQSQRRRSHHHDECGDLGDASVEGVEHEIDCQLTALEARELRKIEAAIVAMQEGYYGRCVICEKQIPVARLNALPHTTTCVSCQQEAENGQINHHTTTDWSRIEAGQQVHADAISLNEMNLGI